MLDYVSIMLISISDFVSLITLLTIFYQIQTGSNSGYKSQKDRIILEVVILFLYIYFYIGNKIILYDFRA